MKIKILLILFAILTFIIPISQIFGCTTFIIQDDNHLVFGRNLDWVSDEGLVVVNKKGVKKTAFVPMSENLASWVSQYGSITFNQFGKELPYGGMNEVGLVVEIMISKAEYPDKDSRSEVNESQWIQYQLDNCKTVEDVLNTDKDIRIKALREDLHYLICDKEGNKAVIEFHNGKMVVIKNEALGIPVLENRDYNKSLELYKNKTACRFTTVANKLDSYYSSTSKINPIDYSFNILKEVALEGSWSIVYDIKQGKIHFRSSSHKAIKTIDMSTFNFNCSSATLILDINSDCIDDVSKYFTPYSKIENSKIVKKAIASNKLSWPKRIEETLLNYANTCYCVWR